LLAVEHIPLLVFLPQDKTHEDERRFSSLIRKAGASQSRGFYPALPALYPSHVKQAYLSGIELLLDKGQQRRSPGSRYPTLAPQGELRKKFNSFSPAFVRKILF